jgi:predicted GIY-YIG superfamily endonuclease
LGDVASIAEELVKSTGIVIPPDHFPPPNLEGKSCLYILEIPKENGFYVGETDKFYQRLGTHRTKYGAEISARVFVVSDKSEAQSKETLLIQTLIRKNVPLVSTVDGRKSISFRQN